MYHGLVHSHVVPPTDSVSSPISSATRSVVDDQPLDESDLVALEHAGVQDRLVDQHQRELERRRGPQEHGVVDRIVGWIGDRRCVSDTAGGLVAAAVVAACCDQCSDRHGQAADLDGVATPVARGALRSRWSVHDVTSEVSSSGSAVGSNTCWKFEARPPKLLSTVAMRASTTMIDAVILRAFTDS